MTIKHIKMHLPTDSNEIEYYMLQPKQNDLV